MMLKFSTKKASEVKVNEARDDFEKMLVKKGYRIIGKEAKDDTVDGVLIFRKGRSVIKTAIGKR